MPQHDTTVSPFRFGGEVSHPVTTVGADGAIGVKSGLVAVTKGSAAALTLAAPTAGDDDGKRLTIYSETAFAHTVTQTTPGINGGGTASDVATFGAAAGNAVVLIARNGTWWTEQLKGVTLG